MYCLSSNIQCLGPVLFLPFKNKNKKRNFYTHNPTNRRCFHLLNCVLHLNV
ncbi:Uncharacterized protein APZ42_002991 [Daphnia magna]|uniref:Uncharacterized protein n=1 Tax=Daphnia magna TaxID=35525 RepID=A0A0P5CJ16_9CRUS|nr:Uncharacterized protein APZ42_002991 [Daphnia magna]